jgi:hypothetical protein
MTAVDPSKPSAFVQNRSLGQRPGVWWMQRYGMLVKLTVQTLILLVPLLVVGLAPH